MSRKSRPSQASLSDRQIAWCCEYVKDWNATAAAKRAGYKESNARGAGGRNKRNPRVQAHLKELLDDYAMSSEEVMTRLAQQARAQYADYFTTDPETGDTYVDVARLRADGLGHLIKGVEATRYGMRVTFYDAQSALMAIGKAQGALTERVTSEVEAGERLAGFLDDMRDAMRGDDDEDDEEV